MYLKSELLVLLLRFLSSLHILIINLQSYRRQRLPAQQQLLITLPGVSFADPLVQCHPIRSCPVSQRWILFGGLCSFPRALPGLGPDTGEVSGVSQGER